MVEPTSSKPIYQSILLAVLVMFSHPAECRTEVEIRELPQSIVERVKYLRNGTFEITLASATSPPSDRPKPFFDGKYKLSFVIQADSLDGTLIEKSTTLSGDMRTDSNLSGADFVNLLISKASVRKTIAMSCAFLPPSGNGVEDNNQLIYFQVNGT